MKLKLLFFCLLLAVLLIPAELKPKKHKKHHRHEHRESGDHKHGRHDKRRQRFEDIIRDIITGLLQEAEDEDDDDDDPNEWLLDLQELAGKCEPNPCQNNGVCKRKGKWNFKCECPKPFKGPRCEKGEKKCKKKTCGRGECVLTTNPPFYECKCKEPFQPPYCTQFSVCDPNPCRNGGQCIRDGHDFDCQCPPGFTGNFCHVGPNDCYVDDGESYRGNVSETDDGDECLHWNSHFILENGINPFTSFEDQDGLGPHNHCRNPDGDEMPWCFFRRGRRLLWDYCDVAECPEPTDVVPTAAALPFTEPDVPVAYPATVEPEAPKPPTTKPTTTQRPTEAPKPSTTEALPPHQNDTLPPPQFATCGIPQPKKVITKIFGGLKVPPAGIPWQVSLQVRPKASSQPYRPICGGVLIESCWVLTATHCIEQNKDMRVVMGSLSLNTDEPTQQVITVEEAIVHENYRETPVAVYNDIALLRLTGTAGVCANETQFVKTACLPSGQLPDGTQCTISGWGATEESQYGSSHLLEAKVLLISQEKCSESNVYGTILDNTMFCAGYLNGGVDSCQGDSGGPLTCKEHHSNAVYGIVSWGDQCGKKDKPGVYTRVTHFVDWINSKIHAASPLAASTSQ